MALMKTHSDTIVFIVDDDIYWITTIIKILSGLGYYNIRVFDNSIDYLKRLNENPGIIFLDYQMDGINGMQVLQKIKSYNKHICVVCCSQNEELQVAINAIKWGAYNFILKSTINPLNVEKIILEIEKAQLTRLSPV